MKKVLLFLFAFCVGLSVYAQKVYFIYLQSESSLPFYVKMGEKVMSSSTEGYLILPKLKDSTYSFLIGQPGKQNESRFNITINKGDRGFLIKHTEAGTSLFDLQTLSLYNPIVAATSANVQTFTRDDSFTKSLSKATDDTTVLTFTIPQEKKEEPKAEVAVKMEAVPAKQDTGQTPVAVAPVASTPIETNTNRDIATVSSKEVGVLNSEKPMQAETSTVVTFTAGPVQGDTASLNQSVAAEEDYAKSTVTKRSESSTAEGFGLVFLDSYRDGADTIQIIIPNAEMLMPAVKDTVVATDKKQFLEINTEPAPVKEVSSLKESAPKDTVAVKAAPAVAIKKSSCTTFATDDDFFKVRRDMAGKKNDDDMIAQAKKYFKNRCFRSEHIKYLSNLFITDEGKYQFFDAAYLHVSDPEKFSALEAELKDSYYANRFKALVAK